MLDILVDHHPADVDLHLAVKNKRMGLIRVISKLPNSEQSYKGKVITHNYISTFWHNLQQHP
jgi:hypothetical protein